MGKLVLTDSTGKTQEIALDKERTTIGRHPDNDICLNDKAVSGRHAVIVTILQDSFLEDLDSTNGTQVNQNKVSKHPLGNGDTISIGRNTLMYQGPVSSEEDDFEKTMILKPGQLGQAFAEEGSAPRAELNESGASAQSTSEGGGTKSPPTLGKLTVTSGSSAGKQLDLVKALTTLGKPGVQVAAITRRTDGYYIVHVGGSTGGAKRPNVNGAEIPVQAVKLSDGDLIDLAGVSMKFTA